MSFESDLTAAKVSGEPFSLSIDVPTGVQSITRYGAAELAALASKRQANDDQKVAEQAIANARNARFDALTTINALKQFMRDERLV